MGSSTKKKNDKKKDFQKPKLKVGKSRLKATNITQTSFKSRGIVIKEQSISEIPPSTASQTSRHIALLSSHSDSQRRESLKFLSTAIANRSFDDSRTIPSGVLLPKLLPLIVNGGDSVRDQLVKTLQSFKPEEIQDNAEQILLYVRAGMTHIAASYQGSAMDILAWALGSIGKQLVSCPGGWIKTLKYFCTMLGWPIIDDKQIGSIQTRMKKHDDSKLLMKILSNLSEYLRYGLSESRNDQTVLSTDVFPLYKAPLYTIPKHFAPFAYLNLFGLPRDDDGQIYLECEDRRQAYFTHLHLPILQGVKELKRHGGEIGRIAAGIDKILTKELSEFEPL